MDKTDYCNISASTLLKIDIISTTLPVVAVVSSTLAVLLLTYYKLYRSPAHRLILYMLLSQLMNSSTDTLQIPFLWLRNDVSNDGPDVTTRVWW